MNTRFFSACFVALLLAMTVVPISVNAQRGYTHTVKNASITAGDTINMLNVEGGIVHFQYNADETSGTTAGKIFLEGRFFSTSAWVKLDSVSLTDVTTVQTLSHLPTKTYYKDYRWVNTNTSASTQLILAGYLRRPGVE